MVSNCDLLLNQISILLGGVSRRFLDFFSTAAMSEVVINEKQRNALKRKIDNLRSELGPNRSRSTKEPLENGPNGSLLRKWEEYWIALITLKGKDFTRDCIRQILDKQATWTRRSLLAEEDELFTRLENSLEERQSQVGDFVFAPLRMPESLQPALALALPNEVPQP